MRLPLVGGKGQWCSPCKQQKQKRFLKSKQEGMISNLQTCCFLLNCFKWRLTFKLKGRCFFIERLKQEQQVLYLDEGWQRPEEPLMWELCRAAWAHIYANFLYMVSLVSYISIRSPCPIAAYIKYIHQAVLSFSPLDRRCIQAEEITDTHTKTSIIPLSC